ncbi:DMT family transporter [Lapillicoccus sp.]|uniref:DMT family transporter n=1 Tax=Lapillicoccus sp. TaxID=1909287 RepID=UPI0025E714E1|nr:DMT family transporter [Lapillicoccus sp.]
MAQRAEVTPPPGTTRGEPSRVGWALATFLAGAILAGQSRMNGELAVHLGHGLDAALWSFGSGLVVLTALALVSPRMRSGFTQLREALRHREIRFWQCLGGMVGALYVFCQGYAVPIAGVALFTIAVVGGQTVNAILVDRLGLGPAGPVAASRTRLLSAGLAVAGVVVAVGGRVSGTSSAVVVPVVLAAVVGALMTVQQATNGRVVSASGHPMTTTWINFATGAVLLLVLGVPAALTGGVGPPASTHSPWWSWLGGLVGIVVVAVSAVAVRHLGVLPVMILMLLGQLAAAVGLDALVPATRGHLTPVVVIGLGITLFAAVLAARGGGAVPAATTTETGRSS